MPHTRTSYTREKNIQEKRERKTNGNVNSQQGHIVVKAVFRIRIRKKFMENKTLNSEYSYLSPCKSPLTLFNVITLLFSVQRTSCHFLWKLSFFR